MTLQAAAAGSSHPRVRALMELVAEAVSLNGCVGPWACNCTERPDEKTDWCINCLAGELVMELRAVVPDEEGPTWQPIETAPKIATMGRSQR